MTVGGNCSRCVTSSKLACTGGLPGHLHPQIEHDMLYAIGLSRRESPQLPVSR
jgi:hypothetical protein